MVQIELDIFILYFVGNDLVIGIIAMNLKKLFVPLVIVLLALPQSGLAKKGYLKEKPEEPNLSIVFGYIDMDEAPTKLKRVSMKKVRPRTPKPFYNFWVKKGMFYRASVPLGSYKFSSFGGFSGLRNADYTFNFPSQGRGEMDPIVDKQGVYFVGSYKYKKVTTGFFRPNQFDIMRIDGPSEKELLVRLLEYAKHPEWARLIRSRLKELEQ